MRLRFPQPFLIIAVLLGGFSAFLAYEKEYEPSAAMAGAAVAAAAASQNKREDSEKMERLYEERCKQLQEDIKRREEAFMWDKTQLMKLIEREESARQRDQEFIQEIARLKQDMGILNHQLEQQARMNELELEIERLRQSSTDQPKTALLPESKLDPIGIVIPEEQVIETSENYEENP